MNFSYQTSNRKFQFPNISYIMYHQGREFLNVLIVFSRPYLVRCAYATVLRLSPSVVFKLHCVQTTDRRNTVA